MVTSTFPRWAGDSTTPFVFHLASDLVRLGWEVDVLAPHDAGARTEEMLDGVRVLRFRYMWPDSAQTLCYRGGALLNIRSSKANALKTPAFVLSELASTARNLRGGYDILHSHWLLPQGWVGSLASRRFGVPHVTTIHGGDVFALGHPLLERFKRSAVRGADAVTVNSSATRDALNSIDPEVAHVRTIPMGVATELADVAETAEAGRSFPTSGLTLLFVGRLIEEKGVGDLVDAVRLLSDLPHVGAVIVGEGPARSSLEETVRAKGLDQRIRFLGWKQPPEVRALMQAADIYVGPSRRAPDGGREAYGLSFAEALAAGTPVIATRIGGISDIVEDGINGILVDERSPGQIADGVRRLHSSEELRRTLGNAGRAKAVTHLSREASAMAFSGLYDFVRGLDH